MASILNFLLKQKNAYLLNESASTVTEYALIAALLSVSIYLIVFTMGDNILVLFQSAMNALELII